MEKIWVVIIALVIFVIFTFLFWLLTHRYAKNKYGTKMWKLGSARLSYWQAAILYSAGFTFITVYLLKWGNVLTF